MGTQTEDAPRALRAVMDDHTARGTAPGISVTTGSPSGDIETITAGDLAADAIVRIQSMTKPVTAVAALRMVQDGRMGLDDPIEAWLPELADRRVLRTPTSSLDDTEPAERPITLRHLLTSTSGYGMMTARAPCRRR